MKVECKGCQSKLNIPDDKLDPGTEFSFNCPKCKTQNTIQIPLGSMNESDSDESKPVKQQTAAKSSSFDGYELEGAEEFYEEGARLALICFNNDSLRTQIDGIVKNLGYLPVYPTSARDALRRIRMNQFDMVLIHENYEGMTLEANAILHFIQPMETPRRRKMFVAFFTDKYQSFDQMSAFALSVNLLVNLSDQDQFDKILHRGLSEYQRFYRVFFDVMTEMGKY